MSKKKPVPLRNPDELEAIDQELSDAMNGLDGTNARIEELLGGLDLPERPTGEVLDEDASAGKDDVDPDGGGGV